MGNLDRQKKQYIQKKSAIWTYIKEDKIVDNNIYDFYFFVNGKTINPMY